MTRPWAVAAIIALAGPAAAAGPPELNGCWKMTETRVERQSGKIDTPKSDCIRAYQGAILVTACRAGKEVSVYALTDMSAGTYSFAHVGRHVDGKEARVGASRARAAAFRVLGNTLHMVLGKSPGASADPVVRAEQRLTRLPPQQCAALARFLPPSDALAGQPMGAKSPP